LSVFKGDPAICRRAALYCPDVESDGHS
jgi:hypothetical protein